MKATILAVILCAIPLTARADGTCKVTYVTVPDGIRDVIEGWVEAEPHCRGRIALRVIPTKDGGLFLFAERPDGTVHERLVPDLTAAGVLVASWVSDSWNDQPRKTKRKHREAAVRVTASDERLKLEEAAPRPASSGPKRFISLGGALVSGAEGADVGFRLDADVIAYGGWRLGLTAQKVEDTVFAVGDYGMYQGQIDDYSIGGYVARVARWRGWELRATVGLYAIGSKLHRDDFSNIPVGGMQLLDYEISATSELELSTTLSRDLGDRWAIGVTAASAHFTQEWSAPDRFSVMRNGDQSIWIASLRRRI